MPGVNKMTQKHGSTYLHNRAFLTSTCQNASRFVIFKLAISSRDDEKFAKPFFISQLLAMSHSDMLWR